MEETIAIEVRERHQLPVGNEDNQNRIRSHYSNAPHGIQVSTTICATQSVYPELRLRVNVNHLAMPFDVSIKFAQCYPCCSRLLDRYLGHYDHIERFHAVRFCKQTESRETISAYKRLYTREQNGLQMKVKKGDWTIQRH